MDPPPSPSGTSTAVPASPQRTQRGQRLERGPSGALLIPMSTPSSPSQQAARGPSRGKWLLLKACFLLLLLASGTLLLTHSRKTAWVSRLLKTTNTTASPAPAFQVSKPPASPQFCTSSKIKVLSVPCTTLVPQHLRTCMHVACFSQIFP